MEQIPLELALMQIYLLHILKSCLYFDVILPHINNMLYFYTDQLGNIFLLIDVYGMSHKIYKLIITYLSRFQVLWL